VNERRSGMKDRKEENVRCKMQDDEVKQMGWMEWDRD
jgi:hypothetical protein